MSPSKTSPARVGRQRRKPSGTAGDRSSGRRKKRYSRDLRGLARFLWEQGRTLTHATEKDAAAWIRNLKKKFGAGRKHPEPPAIFRKVAAARAFFERLKEGTATNPFARFRTRRSDRPLDPPFPLRSRDLKSLAATLNPDSPLGLRNRAIALLRFGTTLNILDISRLRRAQLILDRRGPAIRLPRTGGTGLRIPIRGPVLAALRKHLERNRPKGPYLFQMLPANFATPKAGARGRTGTPKPLSAGWISSILSEVRLAAGRKSKRG
jgi:site-specific recombinase XerD